MLSVQPGLRGSNDFRAEEKWRYFNCFFSRLGLRTYQHPCIRVVPTKAHKYTVISFYAQWPSACIVHPCGHLQWHKMRRMDGYIKMYEINYKILDLVHRYKERIIKTYGLKYIIISFYF